MKQYFECEVCHKEIGYIDDENRIINVYPKDSNIQYMGRNIVIKFTHCNKHQIIIK